MSQMLSHPPGGVTTHHDVDLLDAYGRQVRRWRCQGETPKAARQRLAAGRRVERTELLLQLEKAEELLETWVFPPDSWERIVFFPPPLSSP